MTTDHYGPPLVGYEVAYHWWVGNLMRGLLTQHYLDNISTGREETGFLVEPLNRPKENNDWLAPPICLLPIPPEDITSTPSPREPLHVPQDEAGRTD